VLIIIRLTLADVRFAVFVWRSAIEVYLLSCGLSSTIRGIFADWKRNRWRVMRNTWNDMNVALRPVRRTNKEKLHSSWFHLRSRLKRAG